jgi:hypothetical protein
MAIRKNTHNISKAKYSKNKKPSGLPETVTLKDGRVLTNQEIVDTLIKYRHSGDKSLAELISLINEALSDMKIDLNRHKKQEEQSKKEPKEGQHKLKIAKRTTLRRGKKHVR